MSREVRKLSDMSMSILKWYGRRMHIRGLCSYKKYTIKNRSMLEEEIERRTKLPPEYVVLSDKPLRYLRDALRSIGKKTQSDVSEDMRDQMIRELIESGYDDEVLRDELTKLKVTLQRLQDTLNNY